MTILESELILEATNYNGRSAFVLPPPKEYLHLRKLLAFTENYQRGGGNRYMIDIINSVIHDFEFVTLLSNRGGIFPEDIARLSRKVHSQSSPLITSQRMLRRLLRMPRSLQRAFSILLTVIEPLLFAYNVSLFTSAILRNKPDRIISFNGGYPAAPAALAMVVAAYICRVHVTLGVVSMPVPRRKLFRPFGVLIDLIIWNCVDIVVVNARSIANELTNCRSAPSKKLRIIHNCIETRPLPVRSTQKLADIRIGCIARLDESKGIKLLVDAFSVLVREHPNIRLVLAGDGQDAPAIHQQIVDLGLGSKVDLLGHVSTDTLPLLASWEIYVFPSLWEGFPYSILEAMRAGCAIVTTNVGGIPEAIENGQQGILIEAGKSEKIVSAVKPLLLQPELRQILGNNARRRFETDFTLEQMHERARKVLK